VPLSARIKACGGEPVIAADESWKTQSQSEAAKAERPELQRKIIHAHPAAKEANFGSLR
jgi:hypothetical protein